MRTIMKFPIAVFAVAAITACGDSRGTDAAQDDLRRDLELASSTTMNLAAPTVDSSLLNAMETTPASAPAPAIVVRRAPGPRSVRSQTPTVRATPAVDVAALDEVDEVKSESEAPAPEEVTEPVAVAPRPAPPAGDYGTGINGGGAGVYGGGGGVYGGGTGVVIRGGGVDGDNCELHRRRPGSPVYGGGYGGPVFIPRAQVPRSAGIYERAPRTGGMSPRSSSTRSMPTASAPRPSRPAGGLGRTRFGGR